MGNYFGTPRLVLLLHTALYIRLYHNKSGFNHTCKIAHKAIFVLHRNKLAASPENIVSLKIPSNGSDLKLRQFLHLF